MKRLDPSLFRNPLGILLGLWLVGTVGLALDSRTYGHDLGNHLFRAWDTAQLFEQGRFFYYLSPEAGGGKGLPIYGFYSQWIYLPAFLGMGLGLSLQPALKLSAALLLPFTLVGTFLLHRNHSDCRGALFGTLMTVTSSYFLALLFVRWAFAELVAASLIPWCLFFLGRHLGGRRPGLLPATAMAAAMILVHPLSFMNAVPAFCAYGLFIGIRNKRLAASFWALIGMGYGALISTAFFWLPAFLETRFVMGVEGLPAQLEDSFLTLESVLSPSSYTSPGLAFMATAGAAGALAIFSAWQAGGPGRWHRAAAAVTLIGPILFYAFLMSAASRPIWAHFGPLKANVFVWRLLYPAILLTGVAVVAAFETSPLRSKLSSILPVAGLVLAAHAAFFLHHQTRNALQLDPTTTRQTDAAVERFRQIDDSWGSAEFRPAVHRLGDVVRDPSCRTAAALGAPLSTVEIAPIPVETQVMEPGCAVHLPIFWNPRYRAFQGDVDLPVFCDIDGQILIFPQAPGTFQLELTVPVYALAGRIVSQISLLIVCITLLVNLLRRRNRSAPSTSARP